MMVSAAKANAGSQARTVAPGAESDRGNGAASGLEISKISKKFGGFTALQNIDLRVRRGEFLTLLGPSGSGKTTLLMIIAGFESAGSGAILLDGKPIDGVPAEKRHFGMVFQGYALFPHMTVRQNIIYPLEVRRQTGATIESRLREMLRLVRLEEFSDRLPRQLSGGQQQRVALARALSFDPQILLLDEPLGALDKKLRAQVQTQLREIHQKVGTTFIYVTHDQEEALSMSDRVAIMRDGEIVQVGSPAELYEKPKTVFVAGFLGKSNFLRGKVKQANASSVTYAAGQTTFIQRTGERRPAAGMEITLALRPEKIEIAPAGEINTESGNKISGTVKRFSYFGSSLALDCNTDFLGDMTVDLDVWRCAYRFKAGQPVDLAWRDDAAVIVADDMQARPRA